EWSPQDFYANTHVPDPSTVANLGDCHLPFVLFPFQARTVAWMLKREGVQYAGGRLADVAQPTSPLFHRAVDALGTPCYISDVLSQICITPPLFDMRGGILAEEMGLGKTVELISLIRAHAQPPNMLDNGHLTSCGATLIVVPSHILHQWTNELKAHDPGLRVFTYTGVQKWGDREPREMAEYDVVITTYNTISREVHFTQELPTRVLRRAPVNKPMRSPLVEVSWWRVCLDEAQMVESGVSGAAKVAQQIPRVNSWVVSGTPIQKDARDLIGLLPFLQSAHSMKTWKKISRPTYKRLVAQIALRHTKELVRDEIALPPQTRVVVTLPFSPVDQQNYNDHAEVMARECQLEGESTDSEKMRVWLRRLRQACLHPQLIDGTMVRKRNPGQLLGVDQVLQSMVDQNEASIRSEQRALILSRVRQGHVLAYAKSVPDRAPQALRRYQEALKSAQELVKECRDELAAVAGAGVSSEADGEVSEDELDKAAKGPEAEALRRRAGARRELRSLLEVEHVCLFFVATAYFQLKTEKEALAAGESPTSELETLETAYYDRAQAVRTEILRGSRARVNNVMTKVKASFSPEIPIVPELPDVDGIENRRIVDAFFELRDLLNAQADALQEIRQKVVEILLQPLVDNDVTETTGEEYESSTKTQDDLYVYELWHRALIAQRQATLIGQRNTLVNNEVKDAARMAKDGTGPNPELMRKAAERLAALQPNDQASLRGVVTEARSLITQLEWKRDGGAARAAAELALTEQLLKELQDITSHQMKHFGELEKAHDLFRTATNVRLDYYRQLQGISDTVAPYKESMDDKLDKVALVDLERKRAAAEAQLATLYGKRRYLRHLQAETDVDCGICQSELTDGVISVCGHQFCRECAGQWFARSRRCPMCKARIKKRDLRPVSHNQPRELQVKEVAPSGITTAAVGPVGISAATLREIQAVELPRTYSTKIDAIARHILWLRQHDPGAKSVVFSQFTPFLDLLGMAFASLGIEFTSIKNKNGTSMIDEFLANPAVEAFLLPAQSNASGLNLVVATHVFLCEPLINPAIEMQAIARVHRIGQRRATTVYTYLIADSVEEAVYEVAVGRRREHV
ncbi:hypothetical protein EJ06DRAFT_452950, partial [Trichodelitschia bisporula]